MDLKKYVEPFKGTLHMTRSQVYKFLYKDKYISVFMMLESVHKQYKKYIMNPNIEYNCLYAGSVYIPNLKEFVCSDDFKEFIEAVAMSTGNCYIREYAEEYLPIVGAFVEHNFTPIRVAIDWDEVMEAVNDEKYFKAIYEDYLDKYLSDVYATIKYPDDLYRWHVRTLSAYYLQPEDMWNDGIKDRLKLLWKSLSMELRLILRPHVDLFNVALEQDGRQTIPIFNDTFLYGGSWDYMSDVFKHKDSISFDELRDKRNLSGELTVWRKAVNAYADGEDMFSVDTTMGREYISTSEWLDKSRVQKLLSCIDGQFTDPEPNRKGIGKFGVLGYDTDENYDSIYAGVWCYVSPSERYIDPKRRHLLAEYHLTPKMLKELMPRYHTSSFDEILLFIEKEGSVR